MDEQNQQDEVKEQVDEVIEPAAEVKDDRPVENYQAEIARKNREIERMRQELVARQNEPKQHNPNDMTTWGDHELKAVLNNPSPEAVPYKEQAQDILISRKIEAKLALKAETDKRVSAEMQLREKFPEALDPSSTLAMRMDQIMQENDLSRTPAGRLVAAKLAAAELNQGKDTSNARARSIEKNRVASVRSNMVDGDRAKPTESSKDLESKRKELADKLMDSKHEDRQVDAVNQILSDRGLTREKFFGK